MFTINGQQFTTVAIARLVVLAGWTHVAAAAPDEFGNPGRGGCNWLVEYIPEPCTDPETGEDCYYDDPSPMIVECGAEVAYTDERWQCAAGHEHVSAEARDREGWDYAEDDYDAAVIAKGGRQPVPMGPNTHLDTAAAAAIMATL